jgi:hypothetical protein
MERLLSRRTWRLPPARLGSEAGVTFVELMAAISAAGIGLLGILVLFPLGALEMARALKDDRTAAVAAQARDLSETGQALVAQEVERERGRGVPCRCGHGSSIGASPGT